MARRIGAGVLEIAYVATIADPAAMTAAEGNAGTFLTLFLADGGLATPLDGSIVDAADMSSAFNKTASGTYGGQPLTAEFFRDDAADTAWTTLARTTTGFLVISRFGLATPGTFAIADVVDVWQIEVVSRNPVDVARNEMQRFTVECAVPAVPTEDFAIAA
jgi:hypothetical protein